MWTKYFLSEMVLFSFLIQFICIGVWNMWKCVRDNVIVHIISCILNIHFDISFFLFLHIVHKIAETVVAYIYVFIIYNTVVALCFNIMQFILSDLNEKPAHCLCIRIQLDNFSILRKVYNCYGVHKTCGNDNKYKRLSRCFWVNDGLMKNSEWCSGIERDCGVIL